MLHFYCSSTLTENPHRPVRLSGTTAIAHILLNGGSQALTHMHTHSKPHTASFISDALFISSSVATPQGIYSKEYISGEECRIGEMNIPPD